jgi:hypothetical protein
MVLCSRCNYWDLGVTPERRECTLCRLLHDIVQTTIGGSISVEQGPAVVDQLRFFLAGIKYVAERHPNLTPGPGHVNHWIDYRPLTLAAPTEEPARVSPQSPSPLPRRQQTTSKAPAPSGPARLLPRQVLLASHPQGVTSRAFDRLYPDTSTWVPTLRGSSSQPRSPPPISELRARGSPSPSAGRYSPSPRREAASASTRPRPSPSPPPSGGHRRPRSPIVESAKARRAKRNLSPRYRAPLPTDPDISSHSSDSDLTYWSSESDEDLAPDDHPIPRRDKRLGKAIIARERAEFGRKPLTRFSESFTRGSEFPVKKKKANKGRKKRERQQAIRDGTFQPRSQQNHGQESKGLSKGSNESRRDSYPSPSRERRYHR